MKEPSFWLECFWLDVVAGKLPPCHHVSYQYRKWGASTERTRQFLTAHPTVSTLSYFSAASHQQHTDHDLFLITIICKQEKMPAQRTDMICGCLPSCHTPQASSGPAMVMASWQLQNFRIRQSSAKI